MSFRDRRLALGLTQAQLAVELDVSVLTIKRLDKAPAIARLYDLAMEALEIRRGRNPRDTQEEPSSAGLSG